MATLSHPLRRAGVRVASGFGIKVFVQRGHLVVEDGLGRDRRRRVFNRATHGIARLVVIGSDGFISLEAVCWLHRLGVALIHLDRDGNILATSVPNGGDVRLRRLQALAGGSQTGLEIARMVLQAKLDGQAQTLELLDADEAARGGIVRATAALAEARTLDQLVWAERDAALAYWNVWESLAVRFGRADERQVPEHWLRFGQRGSLLTSSPRLAINPANAILNYLYAILEAETRLACLTVGLDPGLGIVHVDYRSRDSLALDLMEAARPAVDAYLLELLKERNFTRRDFAETARGVCRVNPPLSHELAETAPRWAEAIAPVAEAVAHELARTKGSRIKKVSTPLTGSNRSARYPHSRRRTSKSASAPKQRPMPDCKRCGQPVPRRSRTYCDDCLPHYQREQYEKAFHGSGLSAIESKRAANADPTHGAKAASARAATNVQRKREVREWDEAHGKLIDLSAFQRDILPLIQGVPLSRLQKATGLSLRYVSLIRRGERTPHPRHWGTLLAAAEVN
ncbi:MAG TPA: CRISPR-associated endonuclease Cas1 [Gaiellaceae bacterium]|nr:CRISPR-associated endonuclease Cas1 [Gaiellaceae bacterium]